MKKTCVHSSFCVLLLDTSRSGERLQGAWWCVSILCFKIKFGGEDEDSGYSPVGTGFLWRDNGLSGSYD